MRSPSAAGGRSLGSHSPWALWKRPASHEVQSLSFVTLEAKCDPDGDYPEAMMVLDDSLIGRLEVFARLGDDAHCLVEERHVVEAAHGCLHSSNAHSP